MRFNCCSFVFAGIFVGVFGAAFLVCHIYGLDKNPEVPVYNLDPPQLESYEQTLEDAAANHFQGFEINTLYDKSEGTEMDRDSVYEIVSRISDPKTLSQLLPLEQKLLKNDDNGLYRPGWLKEWKAQLKSAQEAGNQQLAKRWQAFIVEFKHKTH